MLRPHWSGLQSGSEPGSPGSQLSGFSTVVWILSARLQCQNSQVNALLMDLEKWSASMQPPSLPVSECLKHKRQTVEKSAIVQERESIYLFLS